MAQKANKEVVPQVESPIVVATKDIIAGSLGGVAQALVGHPLDTIKVRLQTQPQTVPLKYQGTVDCFRTTVREEGFLGLYKGVQSPLAGLAIMNSVLFFSYGQSKALLRREGESELSVGRIWAAGALVGFTVSFVESPVDFFKSQLQVPGSRYNGFFDCARRIISCYGLRGMYQGLSATFLRDIPANAAYFGVYEMTRRFFVAHQPGATGVSDLPAWKVLVSGGCGGIAYWITTFPFDTIKSTMQTDTPDPAQRRYRTIVGTARTILATRGAGGFFNGFGACMLRSFPANAVCFLAYEQALKLVGSK